MGLFKVLRQQSNCSLTFVKKQHQSLEIYSVASDGVRPHSNPQSAE